MTLPAGTKAYTKIGGVETELTPYVKIGGVETLLTIGEVGGGSEPDLPVAPADTAETASGALSVAAWSTPIGVDAAVGQLVTAEFMTVAATTAGDATVTDDAGNTWVVSSNVCAGATTTFGHIAYTVVTSAIDAADDISINPAGSTNISRAAVKVQVWDWEFTSVVQGAWKEEASTTSHESNNASPGDDALLVGSHVMLNPGRTVTVDGAWNDLGKLQSTAGSTDRAVVSGWRTLTGGGSNINFSMSYNSSGSGSTTYLAFVR